MDIIKKNLNKLPDDLFEKEEFIEKKVFLNVVSKKIPKRSYITVPLKNNHKTHFVFIVKDTDSNTSVTIKDFKKLCKSEKIDITNIRVIPYKELKFMTYEDKRNMVTIGQCFIVDKAIAHRSVKKLGKQVLKSNQPLLINLSKGIKASIDHAKNHVKFAIKGNGATDCLEIGNLDLTKKQIMENAVSISDCVLNKWPGQIGNIRSVNIMFGERTLPLFINLE